MIIPALVLGNTVTIAVHRDRQSLVEQKLPVTVRHVTADEFVGCLRVMGAEVDDQPRRRGTVLAGQSHLVFGDESETLAFAQLMSGGAPHERSAQPGRAVRICQFGVEGLGPVLVDESSRFAQRVDLIRIVDDQMIRVW